MRALIVGIDHYECKPLATCESDATSIATYLAQHEDGGHNFDTHLLVHEKTDVTRKVLLDAIKRLFSGSTEMAVLYFAGHCVVDEATKSAALITPDHEEDAHGVTLSDIMTLANEAKDRIPSKVIILDCCQAGAAGDMQGFDLSMLGKGVTILASCDRAERAASTDRHGVFSELVLAGLEGAAADIRGFVTPAALYALVDQSLGEWDQRPIYKANVQKFVALRKCAPKVPDEILRQLPEWFPEGDHEFPLDPSFEPEAKPEEIGDIDPATRARNIALFEKLQLMNRHSLIEPVGAKHMYHAAMEHPACRLTKLGRHYRMLAEKGQLK